MLTSLIRKRCCPDRRSKTTPERQCRGKDKTRLEIVFKDRFRIGKTPKHVHHKMKRFNRFKDKIEERLQEE